MPHAEEVTPLRVCLQFNIIRVTVVAEIFHMFGKPYAVKGVLGQCHLVHQPRTSSEE